MDKGFETKAGQVIGPVRLRRKVGRGSIGEVWSAEHRKHRTTVAIKLLSAQRSKDPWAIRALENELDIAASIRHEGILQILDHGRHQPSPDAPSLPFLIMEWASGGTLREAKGALDWPTLRSILLQLLDALAHSHAKGFIHRDIKPSNILVDVDGRVKLVDFGIVKELIPGGEGQSLSQVFTE